MTEYNLSNVEKYLVKGLAGLLNVDAGWLYSQQVATKLLKGEAVYLGVRLDITVRKVRGKISRQMIPLTKFYDLQWFEDYKTKETALTLSKELIEVLSGIEPIDPIKKIRQKVQSYIHAKQFNNRVQTSITSCMYCQIIYRTVTLSVKTLRAISLLRINMLEHSAILKR